MPSWGAARWEHRDLTEFADSKGEFRLRCGGIRRTVALAGEKDIRGLPTGTGGAGATFWMSVLTDLRNRAVKDVFLGLSKGDGRRQASFRDHKGATRGAV